MTKQWNIHKFGGTSLFDAACFKNVADIIAHKREEYPNHQFGVIVSAMGGTTDALYALADLGDPQAERFSEALAALRERYRTAATELLEPARLSPVLAAWEHDVALVREQLSEISPAAQPSQERARDVVAGNGEIWSARLLASFLGQKFGEDQAGEWLDTREIIVVKQGELGPLVDWRRSQENLASRLAAGYRAVSIVTGFNACDERGVPTTLGRNGSDFSAAIFAALTRADKLTIWTDVNGVLSGDPRRIPEAQVISSLSYTEAMELAYFGAKVIHPQTMGPAIAKKIPTRIRNTFDRSHPGSQISASSTADTSIKGVTAIDGIAILNLEGTGMIGVPGTADRLFSALRAAQVSVTLISQASSEHSICVAVPETDAVRARNLIADAFSEELKGGQIQSVEVSLGHSIVAIVGDSMAGLPGVAARFFGALGNAGINVRAIAQGASERNISAIIDTSDSTRALRAVHSGFYLSAKTLSIGLLGPGNVGATLLEQIHRSVDRLRDTFRLHLRVRAIGRSSGMLLGDREINLGQWQEAFDQSAVSFDLDKFEAHVHADHLPHAVIVDCTSSDAIAGRYAEWLAKGIHIITPNKKAFSSHFDYYRKLAESAAQGNSHYYYETTVGAALPIVYTLRSLLDTGDQIHSIDGILSGTLAYLFNVYDGSTPFSEIVRAARDSGYTEPDPRDDLSGLDVARKLTILARELGMPVEIGDFPVENLIPEDLRELETEVFLDELSRYDDHMLGLYEAARSRGNHLRYVAELNDQSELSVGLREIGDDSALAHVALTDNIVRFKTDRYATNPLVVQGPGAGPEVTAGGVFGDLLSLARHLRGID